MDLIKVGAAISGCLLGSSIVVMWLDRIVNGRPFGIGVNDSRLGNLSEQLLMFAMLGMLLTPIAALLHGIYGWIT